MRTLGDALSQRIPRSIDSNGKQKRENQNLELPDGSSGASELGEGAPPNPGYVKTVALKGHVGTVTLDVSVNPIELVGKNRTWFYKLVDTLNECPTDLQNRSNHVFILPALFKNIPLPGSPQVHPKIKDRYCPD